VHVRVYRPVHLLSRERRHGIERRPAPPDKTKALSLAQVAAVWRLDDIALREKTLAVAL
jgi:integrase/recombinase XerD